MATNVPRNDHRESDILIPKKSPAGVFALHCNLIYERLYAEEQDFVAFSTVTTSRCHLLLVLRDYDNARVRMTTRICDQLQAANLVLHSVPLNNFADKKTTCPVASIDLKEWIPVDFRTLVLMRKFILTNISELPDEDKLIKLRGASLDESLGLELDLETKQYLETSHQGTALRLEQLWRALRGYLYLQRGPHSTRFNEILFAHGSPFAENVVARRCTIPCVITPIPQDCYALVDFTPQHPKRDIRPDGVYHRSPLQEILKIVDEAYTNLVTAFKESKDQVI